jgi:uncharacterized protein (DUF2235 family)
MSKNIVVCCDGTGNQFSEDKNSNVVKLYTCLQENEQQVAYYHPGLGTMGNPNTTSRIAKEATRITGLTFGYGIRAMIADAYRFVMENYADGDRIYLFGFSRGAYTVRSLAGALSIYGLLCPGNEGHLPYLLRMYFRASRKAFKKDKTDDGRRLTAERVDIAFRETFSRYVPIHFVGIWDTVSSIGWIYDPVKLLFDGQNPIMRKGRHAISVDERRCFYQDCLWGSPLKPDKKDAPLLDEPQDIAQAWFAGVHSDVGGSYDQKECAPAMDAFKWILAEAELEGLKIDNDKKSAILGSATGPAKDRYPNLCALNPKPEEGVRLHPSLTGMWHVAEWLPHKYFDAEGKKRWQGKTKSHAREIPDGSLIHPSLWNRLRNHPDYKPENLNQSEIKALGEDTVTGLRPSVKRRLIEQKFGVYRPKYRGEEVAAQPPTHDEEFAHAD